MDEAVASILSMHSDVGDICTDGQQLLLQQLLLLLIFLAPVFHRVAPSQGELPGRIAD